MFKTTMPSRSANSLTAYKKDVQVSWCKLKKTAVKIQTFPYIERELIPRITLCFHFFLCITIGKMTNFVTGAL